MHGQKSLLSVGAILLASSRDVSALIIDVKTYNTNNPATLRLCRPNVPGNGVVPVAINPTQTTCPQGYSAVWSWRYNNPNQQQNQALLQLVGPQLQNSPAPPAMLSPQNYGNDFSYGYPAPNTGYSYAEFKVIRGQNAMPVYTSPGNQLAVNDELLFVGPVTVESPDTSVRLYTQQSGKDTITIVSRQRIGADGQIINNAAFPYARFTVASLGNDEIVKPGGWTRFGNFIGGGVKGVVAATGRVWDRTGVALDRAGDKLSSGLQTVRTGANNLIDKTNNLIDKGIAGATNLYQQGKAGVGNFINESKEGAKIVGNYLNAGVQGAKDLGQAAIQGAKQGYDATGRLINAGVQGIKDLGQAAIQGAKQGYDATGRAINTYIVDPLARTGQNIEDAVQNVGSRFQGAYQGFVNAPQVKNGQPQQIPYTQMGTQPNQAQMRPQQANKYNYAPNMAVSAPQQGQRPRFRFARH